MRESSYKDKGDVREKKWTMKPPIKIKKLKCESGDVSNSIDSKI